MAVGAEGVVSVASNILPREVSRLVRLAGANDFAAAARLHRKLYPAFRALFVEPNPVPVKHALARAGKISSAEVRSPLCPLSPASVRVVEGALGGLVRFSR
jgi:4-hydroxy-tetrahydrodipicolinate synthase